MKLQILNFFKENSQKELCTDEKLIKKQYDVLRPQLFISCFIAYFAFYLCKKNLCVVLPELTNEFGFSNVQLGLIGSSLYFTYGIGKFINGVLVNKCNVQKVLPISLIFTAIINILIVLFSFFKINTIVYLWILVMLWGMNGWIQSVAFPAIIKLLTFWTSNKERATVISLWSPSHLIGIITSTAMSGYLVIHYGWRMVFLVPAIISIFIAVILFKTLRDKPQSLGLPPLDDNCVEKTDNNSKKTTLEILKTDIIHNKPLWLLALAFIFVYIIRLGSEDWLVKYFYEVRGNSIDFAAQKLCILPLVGIVGSLLAGIVSDKLFKGRKLPVNLIFLALIIVSFICLKFNTYDNLDFVIVALLGIGIYGIQIMIGALCAIESTSKEMAAAATGFTGLFGYLGAFLSSICTGFTIDKFGWNGAIYFWIISAISCFILCLIVGLISLNNN